MQTELPKAHGSAADKTLVTPAGLACALPSPYARASPVGGCASRSDVMNARLGIWSTGWITLVACALNSACDAGESSQQPDAGQTPSEPEPVQPEPEPVQPEPLPPEIEIEIPVEEHLDLVSVTSLDMLPAEDTLVGVTVDPTGSTRFVLSEESGLFAVADGGVTLVFDTNHLPASEFMPELPFTDVVALS